MSIKPTNEEIIQTLQEVVNNFLIPKFINLGMNASGSWINSLEVGVENGRGVIKGKDYTYYLVNGRAPGNAPPIAPLVSWVGYKFGLSGREALGAAFAISKKIANEGTSYYPNGTDLLEVLQSKDVTDFIYEKLRIDLKNKVTLEIKKMIKNGL